MDDQKFIDICKCLVVNYFNKSIKGARRKITTKNVYVVWLTRALQNNKAVLTTSVSDGMYYEITYDGDKDSIYTDVYKKWDSLEFDFKNNDEDPVDDEAEVAVEEEF